MLAPPNIELFKSHFVLFNWASISILCRLRIEDLAHTRLSTDELLPTMSLPSGMSHKGTNDQMP
jgi:hypothetical protein